MTCGPGQERGSSQDAFSAAQNALRYQKDHMCIKRSGSPSKAHLRKMATNAAKIPTQTNVVPFITTKSRRPPCSLIQRAPGRSTRLCSSYHRVALPCQSVRTATPRRTQSNDKASPWPSEVRWPVSPRSGCTILCDHEGLSSTCPGYPSGRTGIFCTLGCADVGHSPGVWRHPRQTQLWSCRKRWLPSVGLDHHAVDVGHNTLSPPPPCQRFLGPDERHCVLLRIIH